MTEPYPHSLVIASDYRVPDPSRVWPLLQRRKAALSDIGAHHVLVYRSTRDHGRVLVTIGVRNREPVVDLLRSRIFFDWFDAVGVHDIPAVFAGEKVARFDWTEGPDPAPPNIVLSVITAVDDVPTLIDRVGSARNRFGRAGIRNLWIFRAFDDDREVLILHDLVDDDSARAWIERPDPAAEWMAAAGRGAYPPLFVGAFNHMMRIQA
jgi:hypothetical protein